VILLQTGVQNVYTSSESSTAIYFGLAVAGVAIVLLVFAFINRRVRARNPEETQQYSSYQFRRLAKSYGLSSQHIEMLERLVTVCKVRQPMLIFSSVGLLDDTLKKGLYSLEGVRDATPEERENQKALIFEIKQVLEQGGRRVGAVSSTTALKPGQELTIRAGTSQFASRVVSNMRDFLTVAAPPVTTDAQARWVRGTQLVVHLWRDGDAGYAFESKILGYDTVKGIPSILIQHSKTLRKEQRRKNRRRELLRPCFFYPIRVAEVGQGRQAAVKAVVEQDKRALGHVVDISAGGCSIQTLVPLEKGKLLMVEFEIGRGNTIRTYGKAVGLYRRPRRGGIMHVMFTRVTRQYLNRISEFVYDFARPSTVGEARLQLDRRPAMGGTVSRAR